MKKYLTGTLLGLVLTVTGWMALSPILVAVGGFLSGGCHLIGTIVYLESLSERV